ncbi:MAG: UDP-N-acetylmuramate dehydrogenase [Elusimicrobiota bacterium]|jgi:UDP-N-acetylmuramate dehydrogenase|nr:UDP-N-acetylmuramate dehydrogenase [Elusimicrobiota bacterium]
MERRGKAVVADLIEEIEHFGCKIHKDEPLLRHTSFQIGGPADYFVEIPHKNALLKFLKLFENEKIFVLGGGTNVLFADEGFRGVVIKLTGEFEKFDFCQTKLFCGAGASLPAVLRECANRNLMGLECCAGIPGTVGGAVMGNAGNSTTGILEKVLSIEVVNNFTLKTVDNFEISRNYRQNSLKEIVTAVSFLLTPCEKNVNFAQILRDNQAKRKLTQPAGLPNAGCIFKNPSNPSNPSKTGQSGAILESAGRLIDQAGLKGTKIGGARISEVHANFIVNENNAKAADVLALIAMIKREVKGKFGIDLHEEIKIAD